jgi:hypothetical protein
LIQAGESLLNQLLQSTSTHAHPMVVRAISSSKMGPQAH